MPTHAAPFPAGGWIDARQAGASGSEFQTTGAIRAGSNEITVAEAGDFQVGQEVTISRCHPHYYGTIYNAAAPYFAKNQRALRDEVELRGLDDGKAWQTFFVHFEEAAPATFRWLAVDPAFQTKARGQPSLRRYWQWQGTGLPVDGGRVALASGVEMRFKHRAWQPGESIALHARNRLLARITGIRGKTLILSARATRDAADALVRHHDQAALQTAVDRAIAEHKGLFIPAGRYRLSQGLWIRQASLRVEGLGRDQTLLDVSEDNTSVFWIAGGQDIAIRNLGMTGHTGFLELPAHTSFKTVSGFPLWPTANQQMEIKGCAAANFVSTERLLFEDLKVTRMASEAFYSHGSDREGHPPYVQQPHEGMPELSQQYTKSCIYHRCLVSDCGFNVFNNNDHAENTSILHCHVERAANFCENAGRFTRIIGNYVLDGCFTSVHSGSADDPRRLGPTQAVIADNVFEGGRFLGGILINNAATQVTVANNLFIGCSNEYAIRIGGGRRITVTGNQIDLTQLGDYPDNDRVGICIEASNVLAADNHIYARGPRAGKATGISIAEHAVNVQAHNNLIENCGHGIRTGRRLFRDAATGLTDTFPPPACDGQGAFEFCRTESEVVAAPHGNTFRCLGLPRACDGAPAYAGWRLRWLTGRQAGRTAEIAAFDPAQPAITLEAGGMAARPGDRFAVYPRYANWQVHHNTLADCEHPLRMELLDASGVRCADNIIAPPAGNGN